MFAGSASAGSFLYVMNADGSGLAQIPNTGFNAYNPSWSPDGRRIAFANIPERDQLGCPPFDLHCDSGPIYDIFTIGIDGSGLTQLTFGNRSDADPAWSPTGGEIAFVSNRFTDDPYSAHQLVWKMNADGSNPTRVTAFATFEHDPDWSPDGSRIAYDSDRPPHYGGHKIWVVDANGGVPTQLNDDRRENAGIIERWPAWAPDGSRIAFTSTKSVEGYRIWSMDLSGTSRAQLTTSIGPGAYDLDADWQPIPPPRREDYKNAAQFCRAERDFLGEEAFRQRYGGGANAHGRCVSGSN